MYPMDNIPINKMMVPTIIDFLAPIRFESQAATGENTAVTMFEIA